MRLIAVYTQTGNAHACDARCYQADPNSECHCICQGQNHGKGVDISLKNVEEHGDHWIERRLWQLAQAARYQTKPRPGRKTRQLIAERDRQEARYYLDELASRRYHRG